VPGRRPVVSGSNRAEKVESSNDQFSRVTPEPRLSVPWQSRERPARPGNTCDARMLAHARHASDHRARALIDDKTSATEHGTASPGHIRNTNPSCAGYLEAPLRDELELTTPPTSSTPRCPSNCLLHVSDIGPADKSSDPAGIVSPSLIALGARIYPADRMSRCFLRALFNQSNQYPGAMIGMNASSARSL